MPLKRKHSSTPQRIATGIAAALVLAGAAAATAGDVPACERSSLGVVACLADRQCQCVFERGGLVTGWPSGYRWDCSLLRPGCGRAFNPPVTVEEHRGQPPRFPAAVGIDRSTDTIIVDTDSSAVNSNANIGSGTGTPAPIPAPAPP